MQIRLKDPEAQLAFGEHLAALLPPACVIYLEGDLGTGKTTLTRGILRGLGHRGTVRSPTYTLIEPYQVPSGPLYHLDLYRLADPEELEYLGLRDLMGEDARWVIEWPDRGAGMLPAADLRIMIEYLAEGRRLTLSGGTTEGRSIIAALLEAENAGA
ncbi:tRNA (adenosine(37)-N6)-threonylcarbamoyltransferase complex ATPase subunit type 1 TsaE [Thiocystis minor]|uniref:tRNA (adenosine(37)-N6)-threonylcarbamoyltransferase complex ATPase subunit type 1 TsaE n=1 Tax=Thiocystis minor TaxID=61597 RepID=UPI0019133FE9|nr:tRNA (adenosine(37)-N6)-threonylcarbamoyltransferase complex ATPase subunit type 1 TsaE [Thiocystis minor]MBK5964262.1 tRNA (adenosine(37)-N6)-threonylcarbamoyltransferase complex ATPase subunit type 1 TsaE [Thiocystis minor]